MIETEDHFPLIDFIEYSEEEMLTRAQAYYQLIKRRHSIRQFSDRSVSEAIIAQCIQTAATAPSGANHQPWHFVAISDPNVKSQIRHEAEALEHSFYDGRGGKEWLEALKPLGTNANKSYLERAPWLIAVFSQKRGGIEHDDNKANYYVHESVGIATGFLLQSLHQAGLGTLTHTPKPMSFLSKICGRDNDIDRPYMLIVTGYPDVGASVPAHALKKKSMQDICTFM
ncbi:nitroreductase family protein [Shewanella sp. VB17]|uniref:nitroreductase family protein n=1 Tax=Shewanella sp. VB17 TaxID=2739432 RepID=UPI00156678A1|nr:nitroreductase family protein [Shewanella sp. VB17]NRD75402.1 nitroreductase family protein [Shewanella sp. VB17]